MAEARRWQELRLGTGTSSLLPHFGGQSKSDAWKLVLGGYYRVIWWMAWTQGRVKNWDHYWKYIRKKYGGSKWGKIRQKTVFRDSHDWEFPTPSPLVVSLPRPDQLPLLHLQCWGSLHFLGQIIQTGRLEKVLSGTWCLFASSLWSWFWHVGFRSSSHSHNWGECTGPVVLVSQSLSEPSVGE